MKTTIFLISSQGHWTFHQRNDFHEFYSFNFIIIYDGYFINHFILMNTSSIEFDWIRLGSIKLNRVQLSSSSSSGFIFRNIYNIISWNQNLGSFIIIEFYVSNLNQVMNKLNA